MPISRADLEVIAPVHPGEVLRDALARRGILPSVLAAAMSVPVNRISAITKGRRSITAETAIGLAIALGTSADLWLGLQNAYNLALARERGAGAKVRTLPP